MKNMIKYLLLQINRNLFVIKSIRLGLELEPLTVLLRIQFFSLVSYFSLRLIKKLKSNKSFLERKSLNIDLFHLFNLGMILFLAIVFHKFGDYKDYRILAPPLLLSLILLILMSPPKLIWLVIISNLVFIQVFGQTFQRFKSTNFVYDRNEVKLFRTQTHDILRYDEISTNQWCNTIAFESSFFSSALIGVPSGVGLTFFIDIDDVEIPMKSKYLFISERGYKHIDRYFDWTHKLEFVQETSIGNLYINHDSNCIE